MHEYSIVRALLDRVEAEAASRGAAAVTGIRVRIGELSGVETELLRSAYEMVAERSICAGAALEIVPEPALWTCPGCGGEIPRGQRLRCSGCGLPARLAGGGDILLETIEMEVA